MTRDPPLVPVSSLATISFPGSKKQIIVARSSVEAEYRSPGITTSEILWLQSLPRELNINCATPTIYCDNQSTVALSHNLVLHFRTKHMELDIYFVQEKVLDQSLVITHIPASDQVSNILTKPLSQTQFCQLHDKLKVLDYFHEP